MNTQELLNRANNLCKNTLMDNFGISFIEIGENYLLAKMPIQPCSAQVEGLLHGGASAALAESVGSMAAILLVGTENQFVRGIDIYMNHIRGVEMGKEIFAKAECLHKGKTLQHWDIKITNSQGQLVSYGKHTTICIPNKK